MNISGSESSEIILCPEQEVKIIKSDIDKHSYLLTILQKVP